MRYVMSNSCPKQLDFVFKLYGSSNGKPKMHLPNHIGKAKFFCQAYRKDEASKVKIIGKKQTKK